MIDGYTGFLLTALLLACFVVYRLHVADNGFAWLDMFRDAEGKPSFLRAVIPVTWFASTVVMLYVVKHDDPEDLQFFLYYLVTWSGAPTVGKIVDAAVSIWAPKKGA